MNYISTALLCFALQSGTAVGQTYYGKLISNGWGEGASHGITGDLYAVDDSTIRIINFSFDGNAPDAFFYAGTDKAYSAVSGVGDDDTAYFVPGPNGKIEVLGAFDNEDVLIKLPAGRKLSEATYISVWCQEFSVYFAGVDIPAGFNSPKPQVIGQFSELAHSVRSGNVTVLDDRTIHIKDLHYDGLGPDAFFYVGVSDDVEDQAAPYGIIPDENGSRGKLSAFTGQDVTLTLPVGLSFRSLKWLSLWCRQATENFGDVRFTPNLNVPPALDISIDRGQMNCEPLSEKLHMAWQVMDDSIMIELAGDIDRNTDYMAFGLSGNENGIGMINADVVVTDFTEANGEPRAVDYYITAYAQCSTNGGVCPDAKLSNGNNDILEVNGEITDGITRVSFKRKLSTGEASNDREFRTDVAQQIVWSIGPLNNQGEAGKHYSDGRITAPKPINFGRDNVNNCPAFTTTATVEKPDFLPHHLYGNKGRTYFVAEIGQAGSTQGYRALTGIPSWGIAWYINGTLIPELHLMRGTTYTFLVAGGDDPNNGAKYHPFYFTSDVEGGASKTQDPNEVVYQGDINGSPADYAVGVYCEWEPSVESIIAAGNGKVAQCFEEFKEDLSLKCSEDREYTKFTFTPMSDTPDLLYYQCHTHESLGWKVHVYDEANFPTEEIVTEDCTQLNSATVYHSSLMAILISVLSSLCIFTCY